MGGSGGAVSPKLVLALKARAYDVVGFEHCAPMGETRSVPCFGVLVGAAALIRWTKELTTFQLDSACR